MSDDDDGMSQLGQYDVPTEVLDNVGVSLVDLIGVDGADRAFDLVPPPASGWRVIAGEIDRPTAEPVIIAAPWSRQTPGGWMLIRLNWFEGQWQPIVDVSGETVRAGRAQRRAGQVLEWVTTPITARAGKLPETAVRWRNTADHSWSSDRGFISPPVAHIFNLHGEPLPATVWTMSVIPAVPTPTLQSGQSMEQLVNWIWSGVEVLPVGDYAVEAENADLQLKTRRAILHLR